MWRTEQRLGWLAEVLSSLPITGSSLALGPMSHPAGFISRVAQALCVLSVQCLGLVLVIRSAFAP
jgi:hypothetical protein